jgi:hypothetical protein
VAIPFCTTLSLGMIRCDFIQLFIQPTNQPPTKRQPSLIDAVPYQGCRLTVCRAVGPRKTGGGGIMPPSQIWADQSTLSQTGGADYGHHITTSPPPPGFLDLPTALYVSYHQVHFRYKKQPCFHKDWLKNVLKVKI